MAMVSADDYLREVLAATPTLPARAFRAEASGWLAGGDEAARPGWLAADAEGRLPVPPQDNAALDGFLVRAADLDADGPVTLSVRGEAPAGGRPARPGPGEAARITTGGPVPEPSEGLVVVPVEDTDAPRGTYLPLPEAVTIPHPDASRPAIRRRGEQLAEGVTAAKAGTRLDAAAAAGLVSAGIDEVLAHPLPRVAIVTTGDETAPGAEAGPGAVPNSNGPMLELAIGEAGLASRAARFHAPDDPEALRRVLDEAAAGFDVVLTAGGISAGNRDVVRALGEDTGRLSFRRAGLRPGGPQGHGHWPVPGGRQEARVVCLPGNPVAAWVSFQLFARPALAAAAGGPRPSSILERPRCRLRVPGGLPRPWEGLRALPVAIDWVSGEVRPGRRAAHFVASLPGAGGIAIVADEPVGDGGEATVLLTGRG